QHVRALVLSLDPARNRATRMGTDGGIGDDTLGRAGCGLLIELARIKRYQQHLVKTRAVPHQLALRVHWPSEDRLIAALDVGRGNNRALALALGKNEMIARLRSLLARWGRFVSRAGLHRNKDTTARRHKRLQERAACRSLRVVVAVLTHTVAPF